MIIIGNVFSLISNALYCVSSFCKSKRLMIVVQFIECIVGCIAEIFVGSYSAAIQLFICAFRNVCFVRFSERKWIYWLFSVFFVCFGCVFNDKGVIGLLPVVATVQYTLWIGYVKDVQKMRYGILINIVPWLIHDFMMKLYVSVVCMSISFTIVLVNVLRIKYNDK